MVVSVFRRRAADGNAGMRDINGAPQVGIILTDLTDNDTIGAAAAVYRLQFLFAYILLKYCMFCFLFLSCHNALLPVYL